MKRRIDIKRESADRPIPEGDGPGISMATSEGVGMRAPAIVVPGGFIAEADATAEIMY